MRRPHANVHRYVEDPSPRRVDELALWRFELIVEAAQHAARGPAVVVLHEHLGNSRARQPSSVEGLGKKAALIAEDFRLDDQNSGKGSLPDSHRSGLARDDRV